MSFDSLDDTQIKKKVAKETAEDAEEKLLGKYQQLSNLRDENIRLATPIRYRNASWSSGSLFDCQSHELVKIPFRKPTKATERYRSAIVEDQ
jgi:hypothetical protein